MGIRSQSVYNAAISRESDQEKNVGGEGQNSGCCTGGVIHEKRLWNVDTLDVHSISSRSRKATSTGLVVARLPWIGASR